MAEKKQRFTLLPKILNGGIASITAIACVYPLDLVKTRLQKQSVGPDGKLMYNSILDAFRKIIKAEGLLGMYRGSSVLILLITPDKAVKLAVNDYFRFHLKDKNNYLSGFRQGVAGALAGVVHVFVTAPTDLIKIQMQDAGRVAAMTGKIDPVTKRAIIPKISARQVTRDIVKQRGIRGLFKGIVATWSRDIPFCIIYFPLFAALDGMGPRKADGSGDAKFYWSFFSGMISGATSAFMMTPVDVVKTRIQTVNVAQGDKAYSGVWDCFSHILKNEGLRAFFKGGACRVIVTAPVYAIIQGIYYLGVAEKLLGIEKDSNK